MKKWITMLFFVVLLTGCSGGELKSLDGLVEHFEEAGFIVEEKELTTAKLFEEFQGEVGYTDSINLYIHDLNDSLITGTTIYKMPGSKQGDKVKQGMIKYMGANEDVFFLENENLVLVTGMTFVELYEIHKDDIEEAFKSY